MWRRQRDAACVTRAAVPGVAAEDPRVRPSRGSRQKTRACGRPGGRGRRPARAAVPGVAAEDPRVRPSRGSRQKTRACGRPGGRGRRPARAAVPGVAAEGPRCAQRRVRQGHCRGTVCGLVVDQQRVTVQYCWWREGLAAEGQCTAAGVRRGCHADVRAGVRAADRRVGSPAAPAPLGGAERAPGLARRAVERPTRCVRVR